MSFQNFGQTGYLESPYLEEDYLESQVRSVGGVQFTAIIEDKEHQVGVQFQGEINEAEAPYGMQFTGQFVDKEVPLGMQFTGQIDAELPLGAQFYGYINDAEALRGMQYTGQFVDKENPLGGEYLGSINSSLPLGVQFQAETANITTEYGAQYTGTIESQPAYGFQFTGTISGSKALGTQFEGHINEFRGPVGLQFTGNPVNSGVRGVEWVHHWFKHVYKGEYLVEPYLMSSYLARDVCAVGGFQFEAFTSTEDARGMQFTGQIDDQLKQLGMQFTGQFVDKEVPLGMQFYGYINDYLNQTGMQFQGEIQDALNQLGMQFTGQIDDQKRVIGMQFLAQSVKLIGAQFLAALYNTDNLRTLCTFPSRGSTTQQPGVPNAWGNDTGYGLNWVSSSTQTGDFEVSNLNTDIPEQIWRSADGDLTGVTLDCDTEITQGIALDTLYIGEHNFTQGASVTLIGSNTSNFSVIGFQKELEMIPTNLYYIAPVLPTDNYRYWRLIISDANNDDNFLSAGVILFGASTVFIGECFVDELDFQLQDFADKVETEGFTNIMNSRAQKRNLRLEFRFLDLLKVNFRHMRDIFTGRRTVLKCLWIPTPDPDDNRVTDRFAVFAKLTTIPVERHLNHGPEADYVTFTIDLDESN